MFAPPVRAVVYALQHGAFMLVHLRATFTLSARATAHARFRTVPPPQA